MSSITIRDSQIKDECIILGFPLNTDAIQVLNFCIFYTKYYIYIQRLFKNNELDLYACLKQLKQALDIEINICKRLNSDKKLLKYKFIHENL